MPWTRSQRSSGTRPGACWRRCSRAGASRRPRWRSTPESSAAFCLCRLSVLKGVGPFLVNPLTRGRAITLTFDQFKYGWANALDEKEAKELYDTFHVAGSGIALVQMGNANLNPWTEAKVNTKNPDRGPLLIIDGEKDHTVPWAIANAAYKRQRRNPAVTEIVKMPNRGHSLTIDHGWREVAQTALDFVKRFA